MWEMLSTWQLLLLLEVHYFQYKPHKKTGTSGDLFDQSNYILSSSISHIWL